MEEYLKEMHAEVYTGTDDNMPDAFDAWLTDMQVDDLIKHADEYARLKVSEVLSHE